MQWRSAVQIIFFTYMEEALKKALNTGVQTLISVTEEVRYGLALLEKDIERISNKAAQSNILDETNEKLDKLIEKSIAAIRDYEERATTLSRAIQQHLAEVDPTARQSIAELSDKLDRLIDKSLKK